MPAIRCFLMALLLTLIIALPVAASETPEVMLANAYARNYLGSPPTLGGRGVRCSSYFLHILWRFD